MDKAITNYIDSKEYDSKNDLGGIPNRVYNPEGYADALTTTGPLYKYYRRDHLGNVREVWQAAYSVLDIPVILTPYSGHIDPPTGSWF